MSSSEAELEPSELEKALLVAVAKAAVALEQRGVSTLAVSFGVVPLVEKWSSRNADPKGSPAEVLNGIQRLIDIGYFAPDHSVRRHGLPHEFAGVHLTGVGMVAAKQLLPELLSPAPARAQKIQVDLGKGFRKGILQRPRCRSDSLALDALARDRMSSVPILLLLFLERRWYVQNLGMVLGELENEGRLRLHADSDKSGLTGKWLSGCLRALEDVVAGLEVTRKPGRRSVVVLRGVAEFEFVAEGLEVVTTEVMTILRKQFGLAAIDPMASRSAQ